MILLKGTIMDGQVVLPQPAEWPNGTEVTVLPHDNGKSLGIADEDWPTSPAAIAQLQARMELVEPFELTPEEEAESLAWRQKIKEYTLAHQLHAIDGLFP